LNIQNNCAGIPDTHHGEAHLYILEGKVNGKKNRGRPRLTWMNDVIEWTGLKTYENVKRTAEDRNK